MFNGINWGDYWANVYADVTSWFITAVVLTGLVLSIFRESWRRNTWGRIGKGLRWLTTLRATTTVRQEASRSRAFEEGRKDRQSELDEQIARAQKVPTNAPHIRARWDITPTVSGDASAFKIENTAMESVAKGVGIEVDPMLYTITSAADWEEMLGGDHQFFFGKLTDKGRRTKEIAVTVTWTNVSGERKSEDHPLPHPYEYLKPPTPRAVPREPPRSMGF